MSTTSMMPSNREWLRRLISGQPHQVIGGPEHPYLRRWYLIPRNPVLNVYLHQFLRDDDARALHDHPWWFVSLILKGGYIEHTETGEGQMVLRCRTSVFDVRSPFWRRCIGFRPATWQHRVALPHGLDAAGRANSSVPRVPCWTLIVTGCRVRTWGFWCKRTALSPMGWTVNMPEQFIPWTEFGDAGCGEV